MANKTRNSHNECCKLLGVHCRVEPFGDIGVDFASIQIVRHRAQQLKESNLTAH